MQDILVQLAFRRWVAYYNRMVFTLKRDAMSWPEWRDAFQAGIIV